MAVRDARLVASRAAETGESDATGRSARGRRVLDVCLTTLLAGPALAVGALIAVAVAIDSPGPIFYRSRRVGRGGKRFDMLKFRTMRHRAIGPPLTASGDERQTPVGRFLASTRLDELPQLWNVLKGEMRLVGPRPEVPQFVEAQRASYRRILEVPPGLTGPTQLAYSGEGALLATAADRELLYRTEILPAKVRLDLEYVASSTLRGDLRVLALTCMLPAIKVARGVQVSGRQAGRALVAASASVALFGLFVAEAGGAPW